MWQRVNGCSDRPLSRAGSQTFLKSIIQAIPTYVMSCFQLPVSTCDSMRRLIANQWWGIEDGKKKITLEILGVALDTEIFRWFRFQRFGDFQSSNAWASVLAATDGSHFSLCPSLEGSILPS
jgi:hypothetical protein